MPPSRYTAIDMHINAEYSDSEEMSKRITIAERSCIVANTLKASVNLEIRLEDRS